MKIMKSFYFCSLNYTLGNECAINNIEDFLGKGHAFVELAKKKDPYINFDYDYNWDIEPDLVGITIKLGYLK